MRTPLAPFCIADSQRCLSRRRKLTRFFICSAIASAIRVASVSGFLISMILIETLRPVRAWRSCVRRSISAPLGPITRPGRAVLTNDRQLLARALDDGCPTPPRTEACGSVACPRTCGSCKSSISSSAKSALGAYQRDLWQPR